MFQLVAFDKKEKFEFSTLDDEPTSHSKPLCGALYNDLFNQVCVLKVQLQQLNRYICLS